MDQELVLENSSSAIVYTVEYHYLFEGHKIFEYHTKTDLLTDFSPMSHFYSPWK